MFSTKTILTAASLAVLSAAGIGSAAAAPWGDHRFDHRDSFHHERLERRAFMDRVRLTEALRFHHYRVIGEITA